PFSLFTPLLTQHLQQSQRYCRVAYAQHVLIKIRIAPEHPIVTTLICKNEVNWSEKIRNHEWIGRTLPDCVFHEILQKSHMKLKCDFNGGEWKRNQMCILKSYWQEVILLTLIKKFTMLSAKSW
ncbi:hypothetical protein T4C_9502, partial [Trichinella pseudospiralis]